MDEYFGHRNKISTVPTVFNWRKYIFALGETGMFLTLILLAQFTEKVLSMDVFSPTKIYNTVSCFS